jgi:hypothetical protein
MSTIGQMNACNQMKGNDFGIQKPIGTRLTVEGSRELPRSVLEATYLLKQVNPQKITNMQRNVAARRGMTYND